MSQETEKEIQNNQEENTSEDVESVKNLTEETAVEASEETPEETSEDTSEDTKEDTENADKEKEKEKDKPFWRDILEMFIYFVAVFLLAFLIVTFVGQRTVVDGSSMSPTLSDKDNLIVDKISYRFTDPKRFDVVVFPYQHAKRTFYIKRIIGLPGETVMIDPEGNIYIDGQILEEDYGAETILNPGRADVPITLGPDEYFVMGDNRNNSSDSRDYMVGNIKRKDLVGRAFVRIYPFKDFCIIKHGEE